MMAELNILKILNIRKGEESKIMIMLIYSFFMGIALAFFYTSSTSLFLASYEKEMIPYAYIAGGIMVYLISQGYSYMQKKFLFSKLVVIMVMFLLVSVALLSASYIIFKANIAAFIIFTWLRIFVFINGVTFWVIAAKVFDLRQAKRLFGLLGLGEVISSMISFFSIPLILTFLKTEHLLYISVIALLFCAGVMGFLVDRFKDQLAFTTEKKDRQRQKKSTKPSKAKKISLFNNGYYLNIFLMAMLPIFGLYFVDFLFNAQTKTHFPDKTVLASFLALFFGINAIIEFIIKTFLSGRLLTNYGLKLGLILLPFLLTVSIVLATGSGVIMGTGVYFFAFIVLARLFISSFRKSIYDPSFQILYQPLPPKERFSLQNKIEGGPKAIGTVVAGGVLLVLSLIGNVTLIHINFIFLALLGLWLITSVRMFRDYRIMLKELINKMKRKSRKAITEDHSNVNILNNHLLYNETENAYKVLHIFERIEPDKLGFSLEYLLSNAKDNVKVKVLNLIEQSLNVNLLNALKNQEQKETNPVIKEKILSVRAVLLEAEDISFEALQKLCESDNVKERKLAALLAGKSGRYNAYKLVRKLINDPDVSVQEAAIKAAGILKKIELWRPLLDQLSGTNRTMATESIKLIGSPILEDLERYFNRSYNDTELQIRIIKLLQKIDKKRAVKIFRKMINYPNEKVRTEVLYRLSELGHTATINESVNIRIEIENKIKLIVWLIACIADTENQDHCEALNSSLQREMEWKKSELFMLLTLLYEKSTIKQIEENLENGGAEEKVFALEIFELTISGELKGALSPLLDSQSYTDTLIKYRDLYPQTRLSVSERIVDIINKDYNKLSSWTKSCATELLKHYSAEDKDLLLTAGIINQSRLIMDTCANLLFKSDKSAYYEAMERLQTKVIADSAKLNESLEQDYPSLMERIRFLQNIPYFADTPEIFLEELATESTIFFYKSCDSFISSDLNFSYCVYSGKFFFENRDGALINFEKSDIIGEYTNKDIHQDRCKYICVEDGLILRLNMEIVLRLMSEHTEIIENILTQFDHEPDVHLKMQ